MPAGFENKKSKTKASLTPFIDSFEITTQFQEYFTQIKDPRVERTRYRTVHRIMLKLRRIALNALEREPSFRRSIRQKSLQRYAQAPFNLLCLLSPSSMGYICLPLGDYGKI